jgi:hypothetical protein
MDGETAHARSERIRREIRQLTDEGLSQQEILSLFYLRAKWRSRLTSECQSGSSRAQPGQAE